MMATYYMFLIKVVHVHVALQTQEYTFAMVNMLMVATVPQECPCMVSTSYIMATLRFILRMNASLA